MTKDSKEMLCVAAGLIFFYPLGVLLCRTFNYISGYGFVVEDSVFGCVLLSILVNILFWWAVADSWTKYK
ncbi:hypothetical protein [Leptolyngbya phage Lbo-JY46]